jgi:MSHA biogenesis protein MshQ
MRLAMNTADEVWITRLKGALLRRSHAFGVTWRVLSVWTVLALSGVSVEAAFAQVEISNFSTESANPVCARTSVQVRWRIDFSEIVGGIERDGVFLFRRGLSDFDRNVSISGQGSTYFIQGWTGMGDGEIGIMLLEDSLIPAKPGDDVSFLWDQLGPGYTVRRPPSVSAITRGSANPTASGSTVSWTVTFSDNMRGVEAADFVLVMRGGVSGARITDVRGSGRDWTVTANTGSGSGTLGLDLIDNDSITSTSYSIPLGCQGRGNGDFSGHVYTVTGGASGLTTGFNCVESGAPPGLGHLFTKLAGTPFSFDVVALKADRTQATGYVSRGSVKKVTVELVNGADTAPATACASRTALTPAVSQVLNFSAVNGGRKALSMTVGNAYRNVRCRVTDKNQVPALIACSSDSFSIRPPTLAALASSNANADSTGQSATASPLIKAGAAFALTASSGVAGYDGTPQIDASSLEWLTAPSGGRAAPGTGTLSGAFAAADAASGSASGSNFTYNEVGYFRFKPYGVYDDSFTATDAASGDCTNDFSNLAVGGKYGCKFGNTAATKHFGRFIPDHFAITLPVLTAACPSATPFSYFGQDGFATAFTLTAQDSSNATTQNYHGSFAKLNLANYAGYGFTATPLPGGAQLGSSATAPSGTWAQGAASVTATHRISRPTAPTAETAITPYAAPADGEVSTATAMALGTGSFKYGRLWLGNAYGSDQKSLALPYQTQYWNGTAFVVNTLDNCTSLNAANVGLVNKQGGLTSYGGPASVSATSAGEGRITLPAAGSAGSVDVLLALGSSGSPSNCPGLTGGTAASLAHLSGKWCGANYDRDPVARATFGINSDARVIYLREDY